MPWNETREAPRVEPSKILGDHSRRATHTKFQLQRRHLLLLSWCIFLLCILKVAFEDFMHIFDLGKYVFGTWRDIAVVRVYSFEFHPGVTSDTDTTIIRHVRVRTRFLFSCSGSAVFYCQSKRFVMRVFHPWFYLLRLRCVLTSTTNYYRLYILVLNYFRSHPGVYSIQIISWYQCTSDLILPQTDRFNYKLL